MHEAEPLLYWRVKRNGVWKFERARFVRVSIPGQPNYSGNTYSVEPPKPWRL